MSGGFGVLAVVYLGEAVICVPIAKKTRLGSVPGYLLAGMAIGFPWNKAIMAVKTLVLAVLGRFCKLNLSDNVLFALIMSQVG